jgi:hypothetical protein
LETTPEEAKKKKVGLEIVQSSFWSFLDGHGSENGSENKHGSENGIENKNQKPNDEEAIKKK